MNNEELFKQHILFEFLHNEPNKVSLLYEGRSVVPGIDTILDKIMKMFDGQIYETLNTPAQSTIKVYDNINDIGLSNLFFDKINFEIRLNHESVCEQNGGVSLHDFKYCGEGTKIPLDINFSISAPTENDFRRLLYLGFGHEITHAYAVYQYMMKYKKDFLASEYLKHTNYNNYKEYFWDIQNVKALKNIHYRLSKTELNAYIAQLRQELLLKKDSITDAESAMKAIRQTRSYIKNYEYIGKNIQMLKSVPDTATQIELIKITEQITGKKFTNYNQLLTYYLNRWAYYQKEYMSKAARVAYDVYSGTNFMLDGAGF